MAPACPRCYCLDFVAAPGVGYQCVDCAHEFEVPDDVDPADLVREDD